MLIVENGNLIVGKPIICGIYRWIFPSGKSYVGQSIDIIHRISEELRFFRSNKSTGLPKLFRAYKKYGDNGLKILLEETCGLEMLGDREEHYISSYNSYKNGYNSTRGNEKKYGPLTKEGKEKIRKSLKKYWTDKKCNDWSNKMKEWHNNLSDEESARQKQCGKDFYSSEENRKFHRQRTNEMRTPEVAKRQGETLKKTIATIGHWRAKKIQLKFDNKIKEFMSETECLKFCKISRKNLHRIMNGTLLHQRGWCRTDTTLSTDSADKIYRLQDTTGIVHTFYNVLDFSKENNLNKRSVSRLINKKPHYHSVNGWKRVE